jgi:hypothetical protein
MIATTRGRLLRETTEDELGDEIDANDEDPVSAGRDFPLSVIERERSEFDPASNQWRSVLKLTGRLPARVPVTPGDRIEDLRDGVVYAVDSIKRTPRGLSGRSSVTLALRRTTP